MNKDNDIKNLNRIIATAMLLVIIAASVWLCVLSCGENTSKSAEPQMRIATVRTSSSASQQRYGIGDEIPTEDVTLQAVVSPENATNKDLAWTVEWKDKNGDWANGKAVTDYVELSIDPNDCTTATVSCKQVFCEQVIITVESKDNAELWASCTVDYNKRITRVNDVHFNYSRSSGDYSRIFPCIYFGEALAAGVTFIKGDGSLDGELAYDFAIYGSDRLAEIMQDFNCSGRPVTPHTYSGILNTGDPEANRRSYIISDSTSDLHNPTFTFTEDWFHEHICNIPRTWFTSDEQWQAAYDRLYDHLSAYSNDTDTYKTPDECLLDGVFTVKYNGIEYTHVCKIPLSLPARTVSVSAVEFTRTEIRF